METVIEDSKGKLKDLIKTHGVERVLSDMVDITEDVLFVENGLDTERSKIQYLQILLNDLTHTLKNYILRN